MTKITKTNLKHNSKLSIKKHRRNKKGGGKSSKKIPKQPFLQKDLLADFMESIDNYLTEEKIIDFDPLTKMPPEPVTKKTETPVKQYLINTDFDDKSLRNVANQIEQLIIKCKDYKPIINFVRCYIKKDTKNKILMDTIKSLELDKPEMATEIENKLKEPHPTGYDIFKSDELKIIKAYSESHLVIKYLLNVVRMTYQFSKGMGYYSKIDDEYLQQYLKVNNVNCDDKFLKCSSGKPVIEFNYIMAIPERALVYDLFLPDMKNI